MSCVNSLIQLENVNLYILLSGFPSAIGTSVIATIMVSFQEQKNIYNIR